MLKIGEYEVSTFVADYLRLDGGAMFGTVPKVMWEKRIPPDEKNRIRLACRTLVLKSSSRLILVDLGSGDKWRGKDQEIYAIENKARLHEIFPNATDVVLTHLHFDHCGGISYRDSSDALQVSFPNAKHFLTKPTLAAAKNPNIRERGSYFPDNINALEKVVLHFCENGEEILPGVKVFQVNGHTPGLQWILVESKGEKLAFPSDLIPTSHHIHVPYVMGYDLCAETSMREKAAFLETASAENWTVVFQHDSEVPAGRIKRSAEGRFELSEKLVV